MKSERVESLDHSLQITHESINELDNALGWGNKHRSYRLLGAVLQTLRDCLPLAEAAHLSAQLPLVFRGVYFEHWRPAASARAIGIWTTSSPRSTPSSSRTRSKMWPMR